MWIGSEVDACDEAIFAPLCTRVVHMYAIKTKCKRLICGVNRRSRIVPAPGEDDAIETTRINLGR